MERDHRHGDRPQGRYRGPNLRAQHALVDPELTYGLPPAPTMYAGVDALAQAIAAVVVRAPNADRRRDRARGDPPGRRRAAGRRPRRRRSRGAGRMACASIMAGLAMNISDCGSEHSIAQAIGGRFHLPHGLTIGLVLAETMDHDRRAVPELFERVADALGEPDDGSRDGSRAVRAVRASSPRSASRRSPRPASAKPTSTASPTRRSTTTSSASRPSRGRRRTSSPATAPRSRSPSGESQRRRLQA